MKVLHVGKFYPPFNGGMETYLADLSEQQAKTHTVTTLVHNHNFNILSSATKQESINGVNIIRQKSLRPILFTPIMLGLNKQVNKLIDQNLVDIIHISWPNPSALLLLMNKKAKNKPWVVQWQSDMITKKSSLLLKVAYKFFKLFEKLLLKKALKIIVSTQEYAEYSIALKPFKKKLEVIPLGLKPQMVAVEPKELEWAQTLWKHAKYKIYTIGRLTFYKNHRLIIEAAQLLPEALFIITGTGTLKNNLDKLIAQRKINNVVLTGGLSKEKLNALMFTCDAFCLPSNDRAESYGMVLLEALSHNKKILVSDLQGSGMKWIASQTDLGYTFDCDDAKDLVNKIKTHVVTNNPDTQQTSKLDHSVFNIEHCASQIGQLYQTV